MPGCITHYIFAKDCFDKLDNNNLKNILSKNINIYLLGSCGPNFFEYCNNVPNIFSKNLANISNLIHNKNINLFFEEIINYSVNNPYIKCIFNQDKFTDISISYFCGFLSHYILDRSMHPYIFYLQLNLKNQYKLKSNTSLHKSIETHIDYFCGFLSHYILDRSMHPYIFYLQLNLKNQYKLKSNTSLHKSIETHIDSLLLYKLRNSIPKDFIKSININLSNSEMLILCDMYNFLLKSVFNKSVSYNDINKSLSTFKQTQIRLIYSNSIYSKLYLFIKNLLCKTGYIENKIYSKHTHCINDLLNEKKSPWIDPFSKEEHNESLINIYYDSEHLYQEIVNIFYQYIHNNKKMVDILNKIENKSYITNQDFSTQYNINL